MGDRCAGRAHPLLLAQGKGPGIPFHQGPVKPGRSEHALHIFAAGAGEHPQPIEEGTLQVFKDAPLERERLLATASFIG
jgi:hypothetical protein